MQRSTIQRTAIVALLALTFGAGHMAMASSSGKANSSGTRATCSTPTPDGITGTDPEPISPTLVGFLLTLLNLA